MCPAYTSAVPYLSFDLQLESFGVDVQEVGQTVARRLFYAWIEDWEEPLPKKNDPVASTKTLCYMTKTIK